MGIFLCVKCGRLLEELVPSLCDCGFQVPVENGIWQFTNEPNIVTQGDGDHYIGYEEIGEAYSGGRKYEIAARDDTVAAVIAQLTGNGIFLDVGCGDGCFTVPVAMRGVRVVAADISNNMMQILQHKALHNNVSLDNVTLCRMNALQLPISENSMASAACNSVLHLISRPEKVIHEIHRVLARGGCFVVKDDMPGGAANDMLDVSKECVRVCNFIHRTYWDILKLHGLSPKRYSWKYDRDGICAPLFASREEVIIPWGRERVEKMKDGFLPRFAGKGFSDQVDVPKDLHEKALEEALVITCRGYGDNFGEMEVWWTEPDIKLTVYRK